MQITKIELQRRYNLYNKLFFNSVLPKCEMSKCSCGYFGLYTHRFESDGKEKYRIWIASDVDWDEESLRDIILHEMIHHYVYTIDGCKWIDGFSWYGLFGHGKRFNKQVKRLKCEFGIKVSVHGMNKYHKNEKIPTTFLGKMLRFLDYRLN